MTSPWALACVATAGVLLVHASTVASALYSEDAGWGALNVAALAPCGAAWLIWERRSRLKALPASPWWTGLAGIAASCVLWILGELGDFSQVRQIALILMLSTTLATILGRVVARELAFPLLFLLFAVSAFSPLVRPLMHLTANLGVLTLRATGVPAQLDGLSIVTPFGRWQLIEACAGVDYLLIYAMSGVLFASLAFDSVVRRALFVAASVVAAILANGLRTWAVVYAVYLRGGVDRDHNAIGWTAFAVVFILLFAIGRRFSRPPRDAAQVSDQAPRAERAVGRDGVKAAVATLAIVGVAPAAITGMNTHLSGTRTLNGCQTLEQIAAERDGAPVTRTRTECGGASGRRQLPNFARDILHGLSPDAVIVTEPIHDPGRPGEVEAVRLTTIGPGTRYRVAYWYEIDAIRTGSRARMKWHLALARLEGRDARAIIVTDLEALDELH